VESMATTDLMATIIEATVGRESHYGCSGVFSALATKTLNQRSTCPLPH